MAKTDTGTAVAKAQSTELDLPAELLEEAAAQAGAGTSSSADDNIVPFIVLLQDLSPEVKRRDPAYVEGAEVGYLLNKASRQLWGPEDVLEFQPCAFQRAIMEWVPRDNGGGLVQRHPFLGSAEESLKAAGGEMIPDPRDSSGRKMIWRTKAGNDLIDTRYHFGHVVQPDGRLEPAVLGFSSTGHTSSREWMTLMNNALLPAPGGGAPVKAPSYFKKYRLRTTTKSNNQGDWFVVKAEDAGWIREKYMRDAGKALHDSVMSGVVSAAAEEPSSGGQSEADLPI